MKGLGRTRSGKAKEKVAEERANMKAKEELEAKEDNRSRTSVKDEDQGNTGAIRSEEEEENHREDVRKLVEMMQKKEDAQEGQRDRMAPNIGDWWLTPPCHVGPRNERDQRDEMG